MTASYWAWFFNVFYVFRIWKQHNSHYLDSIIFIYAFQIDVMRLRLVKTSDTQSFILLSPNFMWNFLGSFIFISSVHNGCVWCQQSDETEIYCFKCQDIKKTMNPWKTSFEIYSERHSYPHGQQSSKYFKKYIFFGESQLCLLLR